MLKTVFCKTAVSAGICLAVITFTSCDNTPPSAGFFRFAYSGGEKWSESYLNVTDEEIEKYSSVFSDAMSDHYKSSLNDTEKYIYNAISYAIDNGYSRIYFPEKYLPESTPLEQIISLYSCDSPFLEHNFAENGVFTLNSVSFQSGANNGMKSYFFDLSHISEKSTAEKKAAYDFAAKTVSDIPKDLDVYEKTLYLYDYISEGITFADEATYDFDCTAIYEALCGNKTAVCDGYADSLMLMLNLAGIEAYSVEGTNNKNVGHVLNVAEIGSDAFYFDASADNSAVKLSYKPRFYCFMDESTAFSSFAPRDYFAKLLPSAKNVAAEHFADIIVGEKYDEKVSDAAELLKNNQSITVYFDTAVEDGTAKNFGIAIIEKLGVEISMSSHNNIAIYKIKKE